jgi:hypothetical protein
MDERSPSLALLLTTRQETSFTSRCLFAQRGLCAVCSLLNHPWSSNNLYILYQVTEGKMERKTLCVQDKALELLQSSEDVRLEKGE